MADFLFRGDLAELDPAVAELIEHEADRQARKLILIPSESAAPQAVREALGSVFQNIYAEGYPDPRTRAQPEPEILDYDEQLGTYRRYADPRYYKGVEYADIVEALARRRCAELFATPIIGPGRIFVNVQPLSGAPANNAVYEALLKPGDTVMGMSLVVGGHLSHGSPVNRSGKHFNIVPYGVDPKTEVLDYDQIRDLAIQHKPKMIIGGYTSYPYAPDWSKFRAIADEVGAYLLADIAHVAGLVVAGAYPTPLGAAHVISFTTHKTLCGPRAACILTLDEALSRKIDRAVFPGEQGGPHINTIAALAVTFRLARAEQFRQLQRQIVRNADALAKAIEGNGVRVAYGGTDTHLLCVDCKSVKAPDGTPLMGDPAARILDLANIVVNRNTIPGDRGAGSASGIRLGTPWVTQRGLKEAEMNRLGKIIADVLKACTPFTYDARKGEAFRAKVDFDVLERAKLEVAELVAAAGIDVETKPSGYPHFWLLDDAYGAAAVFELRGDKARSLLQHTTTNDVEALQDGESQPTFLLEKDGAPMSGGSLTRLRDGTYRLAVPGDRAARVAAWLRALSDGYASFDEDVHAKLAGPVSVRHLADAKPTGKLATDLKEAVAAHKPYFIGMNGASLAKVSEPSQGLPQFTWTEDHRAPLKRTTLYDTHKTLGAKMVPFAGWELPAWYTGVIEEHKAVREAAGLFDVSHMGVLEASGANAAAFLDRVTTNDVTALAVGESQYTYLLDVDGIPIDDLLIYRIDSDRYMLVVNAGNNDKDWAWLYAVNEGREMIDRARPWARGAAPCILRDLRDRKWGDACRIDIALQGPKSMDILKSICDDPADAARLSRLPRTHLMRAVLRGFDAIISRTGYTGESIGYELFVHPDKSPEFWDLLMEVGTRLGMKPAGLGARDSTRTEAGLPLYGHELAGPLHVNPADAGFASFVKTYKPFFVGRRAYLAHEAARKMETVRVRMQDKGVRVPKGAAAIDTGGDMDYVVDRRGRVIGRVLSCAVDSEGGLTGQALVELKYTVEGTPLGILPASKDGRPASDLKIGTRVPTIDPATVLSRFPKRK